MQVIQLKTKVCQLVEAVMKRREDLLFRQEMKFRNKLVEYLTDWIMGNSHQFNVQSNNELTAQLSRDLDQASMEATAALLAGLPLQPEENDKGDIMEAKSQLFLKYFTLFMNLLNDCSVEDSNNSYLHHVVVDASPPHHLIPAAASGMMSMGGMTMVGMGTAGPGTAVGAAGGASLPPSSASLAQTHHYHHLALLQPGSAAVALASNHQGEHYYTLARNSQQNSETLQALRNSTIVAMSNLLNANIESGLMRSIALGYHRDPQTRAAFMEVLTQILQQGNSAASNT